jgi:hypothetical protein
VQGKRCFGVQKKSCWRSIRAEKLVAEAGFEPAIRRLPDYEPRRCNPVIE